MKSKLTAKIVWCALMLGVFPLPLLAQPQVVNKAVYDELTRTFKILKEKGDPPPYFLSYRVTDTDSTVIAASLGALQGNVQNRSRILDTDIRVGDYDFDNTRASQGYGGSSIELPVEDDPAAIRSVIWQGMDGLYNSAVEQLRQAKQTEATTVADEFNAPDFSREKPQFNKSEPATLEIDRDLWSEKIRAVSAVFKKYPLLYFSTVSLTAEATNKYFVNSEGSSVQHGATQVRIAIYAITKAEDGMDLFRFESFESPLLKGLPEDKKIIEAAEKVAKDLMALRKAPTMDPYAGPAVLSGRASGVFFHEIFGHRIEGHRQKSEYEGNTFTAKVNEHVLPPIFSVSDDPTLKKFGNVDLSGHYMYDDEGVKAQRVPLVNKGVLNTFLMSRSPVEGVNQSNGHGRAQPGRMPVSRQGNLIIQAEKTMSKAALRIALLAEIKRQKKSFGLFFDDISGGFTNTSRFSTQAFQVTPVMVYKVFADGRPDELVRGLDLIGTPLTVFSKIIAADDSPEVFNGVCGAESGWVPVSAVSPGILVSQIEVQKRFKSKASLPILPPPGVSPEEWQEAKGK